MDLFGEAPQEEKEIIDDSFLDTPILEEQGFKPPRHMMESKGFDKIEKHLLQLFKQEKLPHGLVFAGLKGIGKATFTYRLARFLLKHGKTGSEQDSMFDDAPITLENFDIDPQDKTVRLIDGQAHPDLITIEPEKNTISVADIRRTGPFLHMTASEGGWRIIIIDDADTMNRAAQNALLKVLEEPPKQTMIVLVAHRLGALIPTIRSRTQVLHFNPPALPDFERTLEIGGYTLEQEQLEMLYTLSEGSIGKTVQYIEEGGLDTLARILMAFENWPKQDIPGLHVLAGEFARIGQEKTYQSFAELLIWIFRSLTHSKARGLPLESAILNRPAFESILRQSSLAKLLEICENLEDHFRKVDHANLDKRQAVLQAFSILAA